MLSPRIKIANDNVVISVRRKKREPKVFIKISFGVVRVRANSPRNFSRKAIGGFRGKFGCCETCVFRYSSFDSMKFWIRGCRMDLKWLSFLIDVFRGSLVLCGWTFECFEWFWFFFFSECPMWNWQVYFRIESFDKGWFSIFVLKAWTSKRFILHEWVDSVMKISINFLYNSEKFIKFRWWIFDEIARFNIRVTTTVVDHAHIIDHFSEIRKNSGFCRRWYFVKGA